MARLAAHGVRPREPRHGDGDEHLEREDAPQDGQALRRSHRHQHLRQEPRPHVRSNRYSGRTTFSVYFPNKTINRHVVESVAGWLRRRLESESSFYHIVTVPHLGQV